MTKFWSVLGAFAGGYIFTWGFISLMVAGPVYAGLDFHSAEYTAFLLALPVFLLTFFWLFISRQIVLSHTLIFGSGALAIGLSLWLQTLMLNSGA